MKVMGVRELKANLSRALRDVKHGDVILVTDRGTVVAELRSPGTSESAADNALRRLAAMGSLHVGAHQSSAYVASPVRVRRGTARRLLDEERDE